MSNRSRASPASATGFMAIAGRASKGIGWEYAHVAIDDHSRAAYVEVLPDQTGATTAAFLQRTVAWFARRGVRITRVLTDNGGNYRSQRFQAVAARHALRLKRARPYRPQTNGKAERFIQTLIREWAYVRPYPTLRSSHAGAAAVAPRLQRRAAARRARLSTTVLPLSEGRAVNNLARNHN